MGILSLFRRKARAATPKAAPVVPAAGDATRPAAAPPAPRASSGARAASPVLLAPAITEKATLRQADGWYTFRVRREATKPEVKRAVEQQHGVHVVRVRMTNLPGRVRRRGRVMGWVPGERKALVALREGERLDFSTPPAAGSPSKGG